MSPILQALQEFVQWERPRPSDGEKLQKLIALQDKIQARFGLDFVNELCAAWDDFHMEELDRAYEDGFLTAFRLWMEVAGHGV